MNFKTRRASLVTTKEFMSLLTLTNARSRGDVQDDGSHPGSEFYDRITDHMYGFKKFSHRTWVTTVHHERDVVGWCLTTQREQDHNGVPFNVCTATLGFYVHPNFRRSGVATALVEEAQDNARKNGIERLLVSPWNKSSDAFFESVGFKRLVAYCTNVMPGISFKDIKR